MKLQTADVYTDDARILPAVQTYMEGTRLTGYVVAEVQDDQARLEPSEERDSGEIILGIKKTEKGFKIGITPIVEGVLSVTNPLTGEESFDCLGNKEDDAILDYAEDYRFTHLIDERLVEVQYTLSKK